MEIEFIAGFGPIAPDITATRAFWGDTLGIPLDEMAPDYYHAHELGGAKVFGLWPLSQAAEATFGTTEWPADIPVPQSWLELEVSTPDAVGAAIDELRGAGHRILVEAHEEPWGQTTGRIMSPEGILLGISYLPMFHA